MKDLLIILAVMVCARWIADRSRERTAIRVIKAMHGRSGYVRVPWKIRSIEVHICGHNCCDHFPGRTLSQSGRPPSTRRRSTRRPPTRHSSAPQPRSHRQRRQSKAVK